MTGEQVKTIAVVANNVDLTAARRQLAACAFAREVRVLSLDERRGRFSTKLAVTVSGHPRQIREFHDDVRGNGWSAYSGDLIDTIVIEALVDGFRAATRRWQGRNDPPLSADAGVTSRAVPRTIVYWKWEDGDVGHEPVGPVWVETYTDPQKEPVTSEQWPRWARRSDALAYAREHGFLFFPDE